MSDSPTRMQFTASPSPSPAPSDNHDHDHAQEDRAHSLPVELPPSHLPSHIHPTHSQTLPLRLAYPMAANAPQRLVSEPTFPTYYPPLPSDHPPLPPHAHADNSKKCPFAAKHEFCPPQEGDVRSPCPALNTMANHGYINRSGKNLTAAALTSALQKCYNLSLPLAIVLSYGGFILLHRYNFLRGIDLKEVGKHGFVEHDASLVHRDTILGDDEHGDAHGSENGRTLTDSTIAGSSTAAPSTKPSSRSPIKRLTASLSLPALPIPLKKEKKPVYYAPVEIVPQWVDALMEDARMLLQDEEWAFKVMAKDQKLERKVEEEVKAKAEGRKLGSIPAPLNIGNTHANTNGTPANTPSAPVVEPSPSGEGYDVTIPSTRTEHTLHTRDVTSASGATTASSLSSSAHSALGSAFLPMSAGTTSTAQTTPAQTPQSSQFNTVSAPGLGKSLLVNLASLDVQVNGGTAVIVDEHEVVASPTTMTASQTLPTVAPHASTQTQPLQPLPITLPALPASESSTSTHRTLLTSTSISLSRIRREAHSLAHAQAAGGAGRTGKDGKVEGIDAVHAEIARGEMAIVLGMWEVEDYPAVRQRAMTLASGGEGGEGGEKFPGEGRVVSEEGEDKRTNKRSSLFKRFSTSSSFSSIPHSKSFPSSHPSHPTSSPSSSPSNPSAPRSTDPIKGVPAEWFREWITYERLPGGWRPMRTQGLLDTMKRSREVKKGMERFRAEFEARVRVQGGAGGVKEKGDVSGVEVMEERKGMEEKRVVANGNGAVQREERLREEF